MKKRLNVLLAVLFAISLPLMAGAATHEHGSMEKMEGMGKGKMEGMKHEGMEHGAMMMEGGMLMLGDQTQDGVKAMAHLKDVKEAMGKMGMKETHHFMVMFVDVKSGDPIETGTVAVKIQDPAGKEGTTVELMGMQGHFGADVALTEKGEYHFKVGTKLPDGKKRQFQFHFKAK